MTCLGPGRKGLEITSGRRDARGLTFSLVIPTRIQQPGGSTGGTQNWRLALCGYGMTLALRHRVHGCGSHRWRTSAACTGSGDPWPDSVGGQGSCWRPCLPSSSTYASWQLAVARWSACSRTCSTPLSAAIHRPRRRDHHRDKRAPGATALEHGCRSRSHCSDTVGRRGWCHRECWPCGARGGTPRGA